VRDAWRKFSALKLNANQARNISFGQICYHFATADFYFMKARLQVIEKAQFELDRVKFAALVDITNRLREKPPRRRVKHEGDFQI
jgi:hypothetical protein